MFTYILREWPAFFLDVAAKSCLLLAAATALNYLLRRSSASNRHWVWRCAFGSLLLLPVIGIVFRQHNVTLRILSPALPQTRAAIVPMSRRPSASVLSFDHPSALAPTPPSVPFSTNNVGNQSSNVQWPLLTLYVWLLGCLLAVRRSIS